MDSGNQWHYAEWMGSSLGVLVPTGQCLRMLGSLQEVLGFLL